MIRPFIIFFIFTISSIGILFALSPIANNYKDEQDIRNEFQNLYDNVMPRQLNQVTSVPSVTSLQNGEFVIFKSTTDTVSGVALYLRIGTTVYKVAISSF